MITTGKGISISCAAIACVLAACGSQSEASAVSGRTSASNSNASAQAASRTSLPITPGLFVADYSGSCAAATELYFYDGKSVGYILQAKPGDRMNSPRGASIETHTIRRTGAAARGSKEFQAELVGFTRIWLTDDVPTDSGYPFEAKGIKPTNAGGFVMREGSMSARQMEYDDTNYRKCAFSQLSPKMQGTVRQFKPALAGASPVPTSNRGAPANAAVTTSASRIPLAVGYYAYVEGTFSTCAKPVGSPWYFDGKRFWEIWESKDPTYQNSSQPLKWEMVGSDRFRITYRTRDEDGNWDSQRSVSEFVITGPRSFTFVGTVGGPMRSNEKHQLCTPAQLPAKERWFRGAK